MDDSDADREDVRSDLRKLVEERRDAVLGELGESENSFIQLKTKTPEDMQELLDAKILDVRENREAVKARFMRMLDFIG